LRHERDTDSDSPDELDELDGLDELDELDESFYRSDLEVEPSASGIWGQFQTETPLAVPSHLDSAFLTQCQQSLSRYIGVVATCVLEDILEDSPAISQSQLIEALAAEIPDLQQAAAFKQSVSMTLNTPFLPGSSFAAAAPIESQIFEPLQPDFEPASALPQLDATFLNQCQQSLSRYIGMMAKCILEDTIEDNPGLSQTQLIEALAAAIPHPQQAAEFKKSVLTALENAAAKEASTQPAPSGRKTGALPSPSSARQSGSQPQGQASVPMAFKERCQQELTRCIGPMAKYIVEDTLEQSPQLSDYQLIETLAAEIPSAKQAAEFRQRLLLSLNS